MMILTTTVGDVYTYSASAVGRKGYVGDMNKNKACVCVAIKLVPKELA